MQRAIIANIRSLSCNIIVRAGLVHRGSFYARALIGAQVYNRRWVNNKTGGLTGSQEAGLRARMNLDLENSSEYLRLQNILLQKNQQRLTRERLLSDASGFFERFKINTKWILIRGNRPFSGDELSTLFSWLIISQVVWIVLGTTTFVSLLLFLLNTVCAKEMVGKFVGNCLNKFMDGVDVQFRDALIPEWRKGHISFKKVRIMTTEKSDTGDASKLLQFNLHFDEVNLTLSVVKWLQGHGLIQNMSISGMRGDVTTARDEHDEQKILNWFSNPHYQLGEVEVSDSCINFHERDSDLNYRLSIYNLRMNQLRFEWCLLDFFNAEVVSGAINDSLFSVHKRQHKLAYLPEFEQDLSHWSRIARLRLNPIPVRQLGLDKSSAFNWMDGGYVDIIADLMFPNSENKTDAEEENKYIVVDLKFTFSDLGATMRSEAPTLSDKNELISLEELSPVINFVNTKRGIFRSLRGLYGTNPLWNTKVSINKQKSYPDTTVISAGAVSWPEGEETISVNREIIKYHDQPHSNGDDIVLKCRIVKDLSELKNIILFKETGVYDQLTLELYVDLMKVVEESEYKRKNEWMKSWGKNVASQLLIFGLGAIV